MEILGYILLIFIISGIITKIIVYNNKKKELKKIKEAEEKLISSLYEKIYFDFFSNPSQHKLHIAYNFMKYTYENGTTIKLYYNIYTHEHELDYQDELYTVHSFIISDDEYFRFSYKIKEYDKMFKKTYYNINNTPKQLTSDEKKYNKLVKIFKLRKKQLLSMTQEEDDYHALKNEYLVLVEKIKVLVEKIKA